MKLHGVRPAFAVVVFAAALAACGGGGGGGTGGPPPPVPTATPVATNTPGTGYVAPTGNVTQLGPNGPNSFSTSMLTASTDGTFVVQSADIPAEPSGDTFTLTEYNTTASQSAAGQVPGARTRVVNGVTRVASSSAPTDRGLARMPYRPRLDPRSSALRLNAFRGRSPLHLARGRMPAGVRRAQAFSAGTQRVFHVQQGLITGVSGSCPPPAIPVGTTGCYKDITATLQFVSTHGYVWVDNAIDASYGLGSVDWSTTGNTFDNDFNRETAAFAPAFIPIPSGQTGTASYQQCDANGNQLAPQTFPPYQPVPDLSGTTDPHISILITNALENTGEGGYFDFANLINDQELSCAEHPHIPSNNLPMFVIGTDKYATSGGTVADETYWRTQDMPRSVPHEFQHYLHALNKVIAVDFSGGNGYFDDSYVDEGESMLAEDLVQPGNAQSQDAELLAFQYLYNPANYSLTAFAGYDANPLDTSQNPKFGFFRFTGGNYGAAYLFARYLYDRFGGDAALQRVYADRTNNATILTDGTQTSANTDPIIKEANGESFQQVYGEFAAALAARNIASADARFSFSPSVFLRGKKSVLIPGGQTWDVVENGPRSPDDLTSLQPIAPGSSRIKLTPGASVTAKLITGATLYFNVAPAGGSVVSGAVSGAPGTAVNSALVQGPYDDTGACLGPASSGC